MCFVGIFVLSAYTFCRHLRFVGISVLSAYTFCWHKRFAGISVLSAYMLCRHIRFVGIYVLSAYMLCRHIRFVGIFVTNQQCQKRQLRKIKECWIMFTKPKLNSNRRSRMHLVPCMVIYMWNICILQGGLEEAREMFIHELEKKYEINLDNVEDRKFENIMVFYIYIYIYFAWDVYLLVCL